MIRKYQRSVFAKPNQSFLHSFFFPLFSFFAILFVSLASILAISQTSIFATPPLRAPAPTSIDLTVSAASVDFHFTPAEMSSSTFKSSNTIYPTASTDNTTGLTAYISSIDENTSLVHETSVTPEAIPSISTDTMNTAFSPKTWGYTISGSLYKPIPKASTPDVIYTTTSPTASASTRVLFGVKSSPDLISGTYSKKVLFTAITNFVPKTAKFEIGPKFNHDIQFNAADKLNPNHDAEAFKHSPTPPPNLSLAVDESAPDSDYPIYLWYDTSSKTIFWWSEADTVYANENSSHMFMDLNENQRDFGLVDMRGINTSKVKNMSWMFHSGKFLIHNINLDEFDTSSAEDMSYMFSSASGSLSPLTPLNLSHFNTSKVKDMSEMFRGCNYTSIDLSHFNTSNVEDMGWMFYGAKATSLNLAGLDVKKVSNITGIFGSGKMTSLNLSGWQLDSITDMSNMFNGLVALNTLNLTGFTTQNVQNMSGMFNGLRSLTSLDLSSFNTSKVTDMSRMFMNSSALSSLNLASFNTSQVTDMSFMFGMTSTNPPITSLNLSNFNTSNVTNMESMFQGLAYITNLNISSFDTKKVTNMKHMFYYAMRSPENGTLDISSFDTRSLTQAEGIFNYTKVKTIFASPNFVTTGIPTPQTFFVDNTNLQGGNGTTCVWPNIDSTFAHIDAPGNPGYFTQK